MIKDINVNKLLFLKIFLFLSPFVVGGYHIAASGLFSVVLGVFLLIEACKEQKTLKLTFSVFTLLLLPFSYLVVSLWAVDSGTAIYGFIKFLPVALFVLCVKDYKNEERKSLLQVIPFSAVTMGILSYALSFVLSFQKYFLVSDRLGGFFQYPNTFAIYCLFGLIILLSKQNVGLKDWLLSAILIGIILLTGSRTAFVLLVVSIIVLFFKLNRKNKLIISGLLFCAIILSVVVVVITDSVQTVGRFLTISTQSSTLNGRLLYYSDALPVILKNPFGLGYYGYYFSQGSFQTGVYSVVFIHNDILQFLLDIGWVPTILFVVAIVISVFSKRISYTQRLLLIVLIGHSLFDFDLQFVSMFFIIILCMDFEIGRITEFKINKFIKYTFLLFCVIISVYFSIINILYLTKNYEKVEKVYGSDTQSEIYLMTKESDYENINEYAESILNRNKYVSIAYDAKANVAFESGDFEKVVYYKNLAIEYSRYNIDEYNDFCNKMIIGAMLYKNAGYTESEMFCNKQILGIQESLNELESETSYFAWRIKDKPEFDLKPECVEYIDKIKKAER